MATKHPTSHLTFLGDLHSGRDEMNLAGHPFALLQSPKRQSATSIFYEWQRTIDGREVTASWRVETPAAYGLPGPEEELLYLVLLQLTRESAEKTKTPSEWPMIVKFSRGDILRRLGWGDGARRYAALEMSFNRLVSVSIAAKYAFYDARIKAPVNAVGFGILNEFSLVDELKGRKDRNHLPLSHFEWNTILHTSFLAGNVRSLALDYVISLELPTARRLFRLLENLAQPRRKNLSVYAMGVFKLAERLGMRPYQYPSQIIEKLAPAVEELVARKYLTGMSLETNQSGEPMALFRFLQPGALELTPEKTPAPQTATPPAETPATAPQGAPQIARLRETLKFADVVADFSAPSRADLDEETYAHLDAFFEALPQDERDEIDDYVRQNMMDMLRDNPRLPGARTELKRGRRREVTARYPNAVKNIA